MSADSIDGVRVELAVILDELLSSCSVRTVVLVTRDGALVTSRGDTGYLDVTALAALLGAMFSATREVARMVGEDHFSLLLQQGAKRHIHISLVADGFMLGCIFEDVSKIGLLRTHTRRISPRVGEIAALTWQIPALSLPIADAAMTPPSKETAQFREYALDLIDRIFSS